MEHQSVHEHGTSVPRILLPIYVSEKRANNQPDLLRPERRPILPRSLGLGW